MNFEIEMEEAIEMGVTIITQRQYSEALKRIQEVEKRIQHADELEMIDLETYHFVLEDAIREYEDKVMADFNQLDNEDLFGPFE
ncbi:hypothetical protein [Endozoicomonas sp. ALB032]|uniref:hypothetical protein n=1 Tax=Endozoicomonas sp. ALB032 TaxID=3403082 RepID=UPI003BB576CE